MHGFDARHRPALLGLPQAQLAARLGLAVEGLRHRRRAAQLAEGENLDLEITALVLHVQQVADADIAGSFGRLPIGGNLAQFTGVSGAGAGFEESGGPKPLVDADAVHGPIFVSNRAGGPGEPSLGLWYHFFMDLSYPIGKFDTKTPVTPESRPQLIAEIAAAPARYRDAVRGLTDAQLDTPYRPGGWTVRQVVHHVADSHLNSYIRFRLALTEDSPTIKPYDQAKWAELSDAKTAPVELSLELIDGLHRRWAQLLGGFSDADFARTFRHPEMGLMRLDLALAMYAWHCRHHAAHIGNLRERMGWK